MLQIQKKSLLFRTIIIVVITLSNMLVTAYCVYTWKSNGTLVSPSNCNNNIWRFLLQNIVILLPFIVLFLISLYLLKGRFADEMYLKVNGKYQKTVVFILSLVLLTFTIYCLFRQENKIRVALCLLYYLVFIAFPEEFLCRDVLTYLLKNEKAIIRYCVPNLLFGLSHVFSYSGWEKITVDSLTYFMTSQLLGLFGSGCLFQFMKEKTRTIWIPVLVHGFFDYTCILLYK